MRARTAKELGAVVRDKRLTLGLTQAALATKAGTTLKWVNRLEAGNTGAALGTTLKVLDALNLQLDATDAPSDEPSPLDAFHTKSGFFDV